MAKDFSRRDFLSLSAKGIGAVVVSYGLLGCAISRLSLSNGQFLHGIASGDPMSNAVIIWTRVTPPSISLNSPITVAWEVAEDKDFKKLVNEGVTQTDPNRDFTVKIDVRDLDAGKTYFYRFFTRNEYSETGITQTLPTGQLNAAKFAVVSCSNYQAGFFNVYAELAKVQNLNAVLHLGDYIYENGIHGYASDKAKELNREHIPKTELLSLDDYRARYGQYRRDKALQNLHAKLPFICIWDDHEIADNRWKSGARNHNENEGNYRDRTLAATQAYYEWLPIRPRVNESDVLYRKFNYGDLLTLYMLDGRNYRDKQITLEQFIDKDKNLNIGKLQSSLRDKNRTMLGAEQLAWLKAQLSESKASWQVLGQQVLMANMVFPAPLVTREYQLNEFIEAQTLALLTTRIQQGDESVTQQQIEFVKSNQHKLTPSVISKLRAPSIPYNLDAWDGYQFEREIIFDHIQDINKEMVVLAGDTHNAWANDLVNNKGKKIGIEFATPSVSSPGMEKYLNLKANDVSKTENLMTQILPHLRYTNIYNRGFMLLEFTPSFVQANWHYVDSTESQSYKLLTNRQFSIKHKHS